ncbi:MAG: UvrD-helicase domain-containing protein [Nitrospirota bacterium]
METYLDITKNIIISSPAGSGKTEKLARRYVSLLLSGAEIEKILAITFTEKAAAEMKERILSLLEKQYPDLFPRVREKMPLMRISTIHSFCLKLLKRFSFELGLDPSLEVIDEFNASILWSESVYDCLMEEREKPDLFLAMMKTRGIKGWNNLRKILEELHRRRSQTDLLLRESHNHEEEEAGRILQLYERCLTRYNAKKMERHLVDFNDLELLTYEAIVKNPHWHNILYSFDEHTDHILVDEFQDTSSLQWRIIDKLTEEWRSGVGSKVDSGKTPTIFLVGDEKQSIYLFRGANVSLFREARKRFSKWLAEKYHFEEVRENYRSLKAIIEFTNSLFTRLMPSVTCEEGWRTIYTPFEAKRSGDGRVELILIEGSDKTQKNREREAAILSKRINSIVGRLEIYDGDVRRTCTYGDIAILLRKRTHLSTFEDALRRNHIPFIVVKGIGFYDEPEVALLRELLFFIVDPMDDHSLYCILRSPIFDIDNKTLHRLVSADDLPLIEKIQTSRNKKVKHAFECLARWIERSVTIPYAEILEETLSETGAWQYFWERQRYVNIKKFIRIIEQYEGRGLSGIEIREKLIKARRGEEPKANINTEGMDAVKIMTVHAAKGLQFPVVFLPSLDEDNAPRSNAIVIEEEKDRIFLAYEDDSRRRLKKEHFQRRKEKELEEEKRLFYVAITRARDFLCMLAAPQKDQPHKGRLAYISQNHDNLASLDILTESEIEEMCASVCRPAVPDSASEQFMPGPVYTDSLAFEPLFKWRNVTEDLDIRVKHGEDWVLLGRVLHSLFEQLSKGIITLDQINKRAENFLKNELFNPENMEKFKKVITDDLKKLGISGLLDRIILPRKESYAELPFVLQKGNTVFKGRIDRIIIENNEALIYDYKTFPVKESEMSELIKKYRFQMDVYKTAVEKILSLRTRGYLLFTHVPLLLEI